MYLLLYRKQQVGAYTGYKQWCWYSLSSASLWSSMCQYTGGNMLWTQPYPNQSYGVTVRGCRGSWVRVSWDCLYSSRCVLWCLADSCARVVLIILVHLWAGPLAPINVRCTCTKENVWVIIWSSALVNYPLPLGIVVVRDEHLLCSSNAAKTTLHQICIIVLM